MHWILMEILKSALRIEKKLDELLKRRSDTDPPMQPLNYSGQICPLCNQPVKYTPVSDGAVSTIVRTCGCVPVTQELTQRPPT